MSMINAHDLEGKTVAFVNFATGTAIDLKDGAPCLTLCFVPLTQEQASLTLPTALPASDGKLI